MLVLAQLILYKVKPNIFISFFATFKVIIVQTSALFMNTFKYGVIKGNFLITIKSIVGRMT